MKKAEEQLEVIADTIKAQSVKMIEGKLNSLVNNIAELRKTNALLSLALAESSIGELLDLAFDNGKCKVLISQVDNQINDLKAYADKINKKLDGVVYIYQISDKVVISCACSKEAIALGYHAGELVKKGAISCGGNGGGKNDIAQAGGKDITQVENMKAIITEALS